MVMNLKNIYKYLPQGWKNESIEINWGLKEFMKYGDEFLPQGWKNESIEIKWGL